MTGAQDMPLRGAGAREMHSRPAAWRGRASTVVAALCIAVLGLGTLAISPVRAAFATFESPSATATYGQRVVFEQPVDLQTIPDSAEILIDYPGALGPAVTTVRVPAAAGRQTLRYTLSLDAGHILPNTRLAARWRLRLANRNRMD